MLSLTVNHLIKEKSIQEVSPVLQWTAQMIHSEFPHCADLPMTSTHSFAVWLFWSPIGCYPRVTSGIFAHQSDIRGRALWGENSWHLKGCNLGLEVEKSAPHMDNTFVWKVVPLIIKSSSSNPGSVWFPEVIQTQRNFLVKLPGIATFPVRLHCLTLLQINKDCD